MHGIHAELPEERRVLVTAHDAFGYFGKAYGFEVVGVQGISTESEAGLSRITELVEMLVARDIRDRLYELGGIRKIELFGIQEEQVFLTFSSAKLEQFGITGREVINTLVKQNVVLPVGRVYAAAQDLIL